MAEPQNSTATIDFSQPPPVAIDFSQPPPVKASSAADSKAVLPQLGKLGAQALRGIYSVSAPGLLEGWASKHFPEQTTSLEDALNIPREMRNISPTKESVPNAVIMLAGGLGEPDAVPAEGMARRTPAPQPAAVTPEAPSAFSRALEVVKRRAIGKIPGLQVIKDADYIANGPKEAAVTPTPQPSVPDVWGKGGYKTPVDLWGKRIPQSQPSASQPAVSQPGAAGSMAESVTAPPPGADYPRTISGEPALSGDSALRQVLVSEPNKTLLQIARSRGVNVSQESLLKPSNAVNNRIINKIIDDFSQDELDEIRAQHLESTRMGPQEFRGAIGKEANQTINLQTFFPELKIPLSRLLRTQKAIADAKAPVFAPKSDLAAQIKNQAQPRSIVTDPATGRPEFSDVVQAKQNAANPAAPKHPANAVPEDLTSILEESLRRAREQKAAQ